MRAEATSSRLPAPSNRTAASTLSGVTTKRGSGGALAPMPMPTYGYGLRRPTTATSSVTSSTTSSATRRYDSGENTKASPPKLALHELQSPQQPANATATTSFLKRGSGRTIATLGTPAIATPPSSQSSVRRKSGSPTSQTAATPGRSSVSRPNPHVRPRSRGSSLKGESEDQYMPTHQHEIQSSRELAQFSPEPYLRQRKRSADMMELQGQLSAYESNAYAGDRQVVPPAQEDGAGGRHMQRNDHEDQEEVDEPPVLAQDEAHANQTLTLPTTPPRRASTGTESYGDGLPVSPPDSKRLKRLTRSPKTPLGISSYVPSDGDGLSATQRVRLSLSGYMTVASLTGPGSKERSTGNSSDTGGPFLTNSASSSSAAPTVTTDGSALPGVSLSEISEIPRSFTGSRTPPATKSSALKRSKFGASRSQSSPAQVATALLPTKHSVDCLMGYIRELQLSEATLRLQVEKTRRQKHDELSRSMHRVNSLETTMNQIESERERERQQLEEQQQLIQQLMSEVARLQESMYYAQQVQSPDQQHTHNQDQQQYEATGENAPYHPEPPHHNDAYPQDYAQEVDAQAEQPDTSQWVETSEPPTSESYSTEQHHEQNLYDKDANGNYFHSQPSIIESVEPSPAPVESTTVDDDQVVAPRTADGETNRADHYTGVEEDSETRFYQHQYQDQADLAMPTSDQFAEATPEWTDARADGYHNSAHQQYPHDNDPAMPALPHGPPQSEWTDDQHAAYYDPSYGYQDQGHDQSQYQYQDQYQDQCQDQSNDQYDTPSQTKPAAQPQYHPPLSPMATQPTWNPMATVGARAPMIDPPPPMFRIAPRLSDIISPLARSGAAGLVTAAGGDHNVLKPVTAQALGNLAAIRVEDDEKSRRHKQQPLPLPLPRANRSAHPMTPPHNGPPVFSMGDISSTFEPTPNKLPTPPPSSQGSSTTGYQAPVASSGHGMAADHQPPVSEAPPVNPAVHEEQFVPATQFFNPLQKVKLASHKAPSPSAAVTESPPTKIPLDKLLVEFFTTVDKQKLRMVEGYTKRYKGHEDKLFAELAKKYGADKVAALKHKFEHGTTGAEELLKEVSSLSYEGRGTGIVGSPVLYDGSSPSSAQQQPVEVPHSPRKSSSPSPKVSPNGVRRRGPPLPFAFADTTECDAREDDPTQAIPPPPVISVAVPPPFPPRSPALGTGAPSSSSPPRLLAPSPPRGPPPKPSLRSPVRNVGIVRQRVSPQSRRQQADAGSSPPPPPFPPIGLSSPVTDGPSPLKPLSGKISPNAQPATLDTLLKELYRKHQPDKLKNVPAVVKEYTGKERELVALLKQKYGALSVKRLELNLEALERQGGIAASPGTVASASSTVVAAGSSTKPPAATLKKRGWSRRLFDLLFKLVLVMLLALGGVATLNHFQCGTIFQDATGSTSSDSTLNCDTLQNSIDTFELSRFTEYVQRVESPLCFCDAWTAREHALWQSPAESSSHIDLLKLTLFSRTIAEPVVLYAAETYLPDLPYSEYYDVYVKPTVDASQKYYSVYAQPIIDESKEHYAVYAKPVIHVVHEYAGVGFEQAKTVWTHAETHVSELPWSEYYESYVRPAARVGQEYMTVGIEHAVKLYGEMSVVATDLWAQLVEMYNEEGGAPVDDHAQDTEKEWSSPSDALTKAAIASSTLAEPVETAPPSEEIKANDPLEATVVTESGDDAEPTASVSVEDTETETVAVVGSISTVEIAVEQNELGVEYTDASAVSIENEQATTTAVRDDAADTVASNGVMDGTIDVAASEQDHGGSDVDIREEFRAVVSESVAETEINQSHDHETEREPADEPTEQLRSEHGEEIFASILADGVISSSKQEGKPGEAGPMEVAQPTASERIEKTATAEANEDAATHTEREPVDTSTPIEELSIGRGEETLTMHPPEEVSLFSELEEEAAPNEPIVVAQDDSAPVELVNDEITSSEEQLQQPTERGSIDPVAVAPTLENAAAAIDLSLDSSSVDEADVVVSPSSTAVVNDAVVVNEPDATTELDASTTPDGEVVIPTKDEEEEVFQFLEELDGLDPLELLDLADTAAAELYSTRLSEERA